MQRKGNKIGKLGAGKPFKIMVSRVDCVFLIISAYFASTYSFTPEKWVFFGLFSSPSKSESGFL